MTDRSDPLGRTKETDCGYKTPCLIFTGPGRLGTNKEYGKFGKGGRLAHRVSYERHVGPIPAGLVIDHLCRIPLCLRPSHLEAVTQRENLRRSNNHVGLNMVKPGCDNGHQFTPENTYTARGRRECRLCRRAACQRFNERRRSA